MQPPDIITYIENGEYSDDDIDEVVEWYYLTIKKHIEELVSIKKALARYRYRLMRKNPKKKWRLLLISIYVDRRCAEILSWMMNLIEVLETQEAECRKL
ncbi:MAG: hypothetical protein ACE5KU_00030 [Nitrososphaerales archaeon]